VSARDELIQIIWDGAVADRVKDGSDLRNVPVVRPKVEAMADAILAAGYTKPRTISTVEELDALPVDSVVRSDMCNVYVKDYDLDDPSAIWWVTAGAVSEYQSNRILLPATVLYEPTPKELT
jgi:hypothetical protein